MIAKIVDFICVVVALSIVAFIVYSINCTPPAGTPL
jgi:hypothetical protein